ncbi:MAG: serine/threonine protein phosphatase [Caldimicrobium sp.]|nr:serine/threonine protein phosphatase [Caldimicrobium sp.]MCX7612770.1 serine/threonine protein phosphatase [Caldimicrobium sp.]MDW8182122.1 metallophosphoesterase family protein [Caldimicrobium sp.]
MIIEEPVFGTSIFAIGDIHGCLSAFESLLDILPVRWGEDYVIFLGDYIDRGPDSKRVLELIIDLKKDYPNTVHALKGNHEWLFEQYLEGRYTEVFLYNGGTETLRNYLEKGKINIPEEQIDFLRSLPLYLSMGKYLFVHAGVNPKKPFDEQTEEDLLWIRGSFYNYDGKFERTVVFGHTPFPEVLLLDDRIGIDTGCVYGGKLTAIKLPERKVFQISCRR